MALYFVELFADHVEPDGVQAFNAQICGVSACVDHPGFGQQTALHVGADFLHALDGEVVEGGDDDLVLQTVFHDQVINSLFDAGVFVVAGLDFDVGYDVGILNQFEIFSQSGDMLGFALACKLETYVKLLQFFQGVILDKAGTVYAGTVDAFIVNDDNFLVLREMNIQFDAVAAFGFHSLLECQHGVFGIQTTEASMCEILNHSKVLHMT